MEKKEAIGEKEKIPDEGYQGLDAKFVQLIENEIIDQTPKIQWKSIVGLDSQKKILYETIVWPMMRPDIFSGLRAPPKGLLLFGPPGTGKSMIGKVIASELNYTLFMLSASSLTSEWIIQGEKLIRTLFAVATIKQPSVVLIDGVDELFSKVDEEEEEYRRRMITELLVQFDNASLMGDTKILAIGTTSRPQDVNEALRKRLQKRIFIQLPDATARKKLLQIIFEDDSSKGSEYDLSEEEIQEIVDLTEGFSGADLRDLCAEAAIVQLTKNNASEQVNTRPIKREDFQTALKMMKPTTSENELEEFKKWNRLFGSFQVEESEKED